MMRLEASRNRRRRFSDEFDAQALALLPQAQRALLQEWLKSGAQRRSWEALLKIAGTGRIEPAESLALVLAECGAAVLEERFEHATWQPDALLWRDYEQLCAALGRQTKTVKRNAFAAAWEAARQTDWQRAALADAWRALPDMPADKGLIRLELLIRLNDWLREGEGGLRREFELYARQRTKSVTQAEWTWLDETFDLAECGIERHAPALWVAGNVRLQIGERWLDVGAAGDFLALTPRTLNGLSAFAGNATHYRLLENRTSFENVAREAVGGVGGVGGDDAIVLWLPGYAPHWWRTAVGKLVDTLPLPARISCDADPDGVRIALRAAEVWTARGIGWEPYAMSRDDAAASRHKLPLTERDAQLAHSLLQQVALPSALKELMQWCIEHRCKAEQENWL